MSKKTSRALKTRLRSLGSKRRAATRQREDVRRLARRFRLEVICKSRGKAHPMDRDPEIWKAVGRSSDGSGYDFETGERDNVWYYVQERAALAALKRVQQLPRVKAKVERMT